MFVLQDFFEFVLKKRVLSLLVLMEIGLLYVIYTNVYYINRFTGMPILDMEIGYSIERVNEIFYAYGDYGAMRYQLIMLADLPHPAVYGAILSALIWAMCGGGKFGWLAVLPLLAALFDWGENLYIWQMVSAPLPVDAELVETGNILSLFKHGFFGASMLALMLLFFRKLIRGLMA